MSLARVLAERGIDRLAVVCSASAVSRYGDLLASLSNRTAFIFDRAEAHCPEPVVEAFRESYRTSSATAVLTIGGGSAVGLGKILSAEEGATFIALPTTFSGSELTPIFGRRIGEEKRTARDVACMPRLVVYDPSLIANLPQSVAIETGMNSLAHAVEGLLLAANDHDVVALARSAIRSHLSALGGFSKNPVPLEASVHAMRCALNGGAFARRCGIALHHQLCHALGG
ncbi:MAG: iron-containing alcohol dehydrogenase, partial [Parvularculaceae bacterium]|nr:iron-containing alcohol dehydrogenase [Parvularculaceae bacterium]